MEKPGVLFLCTHNSARSQLAEALLRRRAGDRYRVYSADLACERVESRVQGSEEMQLAAFRRTREEIDVRIRDWLRDGG